MPLERREHMHQPGVKQHLLAANDDLNPAVAPGMRVRLDGASINTTLATSLGTVIAADQWDTHIVRLDIPATYHNDAEIDKRLNEIRVLWFNRMPIS